MTYVQDVPKGPKCDATLRAVLDNIVLRSENCHALVKYDIQPTKVVLTYDDAQCVEADGEI